MLVVWLFCSTGPVQGTIGNVDVAESAEQNAMYLVEAVQGLCLRQREQEKKKQRCPEVEEVVVTRLMLM